MRKGFTLVELLAVIVILAAVSTITYNLIAGNIKTTKKKSFEISSANLLESAKEYVTKYMESNDFPEGGISALDPNLGIEKNTFTSGIVEKLDGKIVLVNVSDGSYCANGTKTELKITEGNCSSIDDTNPDLKLKLIKSSTTSAQIMVKTQDSGSGINNYEFCYGKDSTSMNCKKYDKNNVMTLIKDIIKIDDLQPNEKYIISVTSENNAKEEKFRKTTTTLDITTKMVEEPQFSISSGTFATTKELTITYPENTGGYIYKYDVIIPDGEKIPTKVLDNNVTKDTIEINRVMTVHAYIEKNNELLNENSITISGIDVDAPIVNLIVPNIEEWSTEKTITIDANDGGVGLALKPYSFDKNQSWNKESELTLATSTDLYIYARDRLGNISNEFTINGDSNTKCNMKTKICKIEKIDSLPPDITIEIISGTNKNGYYIDDVKLKITIIDKYLYNGNKITGGVGFEPSEDSLIITKNGSKLDYEQENLSTYYVTLKENIAIDDLVKVVVSDKLGNKNEETKEVKIDRQTPILSTYQSQVGLNTDVDYPYANNINAKFGPLGGNVVCDPSNNNVMVGTKVTVNCTATGNNGLVSKISFTGAHQYPATYNSRTCSHNVCVESGCCQWSWDGGCNITGGVCTPTQDCVSSGCCKEESRSYDCSYYSCPNGGHLSGTTCVF